VSLEPVRSLFGVRIDFGEIKRKKFKKKEQSAAPSGEGGGGGGGGCRRISTT